MARTLRTRLLAQGWVASGNPSTFLLKDDDGLVMAWVYVDDGGCGAG
jgi:hypothetical protein